MHSLSDTNSMQSSNASAISTICSAWSVERLHNGHILYRLYNIVCMAGSILVGAYTSE